MSVGSTNHIANDIEYKSPSALMGEVDSSLDRLLYDFPSTKMKGILLSSL